MTWTRGTNPRRIPPLPLSANRVRAAQLELRQRAESAKEAAAVEDHPAAKAALRGKAKGLTESVDVLEALLCERPIRFRGKP